ALQPESTPNPVLQHLYACMRARALDKTAPLPPLDSRLQALLRPVASLETTNRTLVSKMKSEFPLDMMDTLPIGVSGRSENLRRAAGSSGGGAGGAAAGGVAPGRAPVRVNMLGQEVRPIALQSYGAGAGGTAGTSTVALDADKKRK